MFRFVRAVERGTARRSSPPRSGSALLFSPPPTFFACRAMTSRHTRERKQCFFLLLFSSAMRPLPRPESFTEGLVWPCIDAPRGGQGKRTRDLLDAGASLLPFFWTLWHHQPLKFVVSQTRTLLSPLDLRPPRIRFLTLHNSPFPHEPTEWLSPCPPRWLSGPRSPRVAPGKSRFGWHADRRKGQRAKVAADAPVFFSFPFLEPPPTKSFVPLFLFAPFFACSVPPFLVRLLRRWSPEFSSSDRNTETHATPPPLPNRNERKQKTFTAPPSSRPAPRLPARARSPRALPPRRSTTSSSCLSASPPCPAP